MTKKPSSISLLSDIVDPNAEPDFNALGELAAPIQFPEEAEKTEAPVKRRIRKTQKTENSETVATEKKKTRGRKKTEELVAEETQPIQEFPVENIPEANVSETLVETTEIPSSVETEKPVQEPQESFSQEQNSDQESSEIDSQEKAPSQNPENLQDQRDNRRFQDKRFNNGYKNNGRFNKYGKNQKRYIEEPEEILPPPAPEKVAEAIEKWKNLRKEPMFELQRMAQELEIPDVRRLRKQALIYKILAATTGEDIPI